MGKGGAVVMEANEHEESSPDMIAHKLGSRA